MRFQLWSLLFVLVLAGCGTTNLAPQDRRIACADQCMPCEVATDRKILDLATNNRHVLAYRGSSG